MADFVFLHGGGQGGWVWDQTVAAIALQAGALPSGGKPAPHCLALDAPGCGAKRGRDTAGIGFADITAEFIADIEAAGLRDVVLVGHSQAGCTIPAMAKLRPDLFRALVYVSCIAPEPGLTVIDMVSKRMQDPAATSPSAVANTDLSPRERSRAMFCNDMRAPQAEAFLDLLGADGWPGSCYAQAEWSYDNLTAHRSHYVLCLQDAVLTLPWQERFAERLHAAHLHRIDAGHQAMNTRPQALAEMLLGLA